MSAPKLDAATCREVARLIQADVGRIDEPWAVQMRRTILAMVDRLAAEAESRPARLSDWLAAAEGSTLGVPGYGIEHVVDVDVLRLEWLERAVDADGVHALVRAGVDVRRVARLLGRAGDAAARRRLRGAHSRRGLRRPAMRDHPDIRHGGGPPEAEDCETCEGRGGLWADPCPTCDGTGHAPEREPRDDARDPYWQPGPEDDHA